MNTETETQSPLQVLELELEAQPHMIQLRRLQAARAKYPEVVAWEKTRAKWLRIWQQICRMEKRLEKLNPIERELFEETKRLASQLPEEAQQACDLKPGGVWP